MKVTKTRVGIIIDINNEDIAKLFKERRGITDVPLETLKDDLYELLDDDMIDDIESDLMSYIDGRNY